MPFAPEFRAGDHVVKATPEFLEVCRRVLGDDSSQTILKAMSDNDPRLHLIKQLAMAKFRKRNRSLVAKYFGVDVP